MGVEVVVFQLEVFLEMNAVAVLAHYVAFLGLIAVVVGAIATNDVPVVLLPQTVLIVSMTIVVASIGSIERAGIILVFVAPAPSAIPIPVHLI